EWMLATAISAFPTLGMIVATRRPENRIGWVLGVVGLGVVSFDAEQYARYTIITEPGSLPFGPLAIWMAHWMWLVGISPVPTFLLLLFPDGHLPSPRWRWVAWSTAIGVATAVLVTAIQPGDLGRGVQNPFGVEALDPLYPALVDNVLLLLFIPVILCALSLVYRFRRARGVERQQLKWLVWAMVPVVIGFGFGDYLPGDFANLSTFVAVVALVTAMGLAIFKYRLYDIDRLINRTLVYGVLTALLAGVYAFCVVLVPRLVGGSQGSEIVVAGSTLLVAALFQPARKRIQAFIDRRFYRSRYDAQRTVEAFGTRLRDQVQLHEVSNDLLGVVRTTLQPAHASLWLRTKA
ncbi:MAG TPA: hypothetical protein VE712_01135, partial [Actinomycetota bacterium]|nr:hypothetical protein [Actinomycetota bacterium]